MTAYDYLFRFTNKIMKDVKDEMFKPEDEDAYVVKKKVKIKPPKVYS
jgi:hypothetical protein